MDQPTIKLVQRLKGKSRKIMCNYNNKLRDTHKHTHTKEAENDDININMEEVNTSSDFRMCLDLNNHQLKIDCYKYSLVYRKRM